MRYVSTRGEAPADRLPRRRAGGPRARRRPLCARGLAAADARRDRRLRRPALCRGRRRRSWPASPATRSRTPTCWRWRSEAYAGFTHAAVTPLRQLSPGLWLLELFHGPTLAFKDVAMQLLARLYEHALARQGPDADRRLRHLRRHRRGGGRGAGRPKRVRAGGALSRRARSARCSAGS